MRGVPPPLWGPTPIPVPARERQAGRMDRPALDLIRVFEYDPELLEDVDERIAGQLRRRLAVRRAWAEPGEWQPAFAPQETVGHFGLLVVDGLLIRTATLA